MGDFEALTQLQLAFANDAGQITLWCWHNGVTEDGKLRFGVINGAWDGTFQDNVIHVDYTNTDFSGHLVWAGQAPFHERDYNDAIAWIREQVSDPDYAMLPLEHVFQFKPKYRTKYDLYSKYQDDDDDWYPEDDEDSVPF